MEHDPHASGLFGAHATRAASGTRAGVVMFEEFVAPRAAVDESMRVRADGLA